MFYISCICIILDILLLDTSLFSFRKKGQLSRKKGIFLWQESSDQLLLISSWQRNFAKKSMIVTNHTKKRLSIEKKNILGRERNSFLFKLHLLRSSHFIEISTIWRKQLSFLDKFKWTKFWSGNDIPANFSLISLNNRKYV